MAETFSEITDRLAEFSPKQHVFFVATSLASLDGLVNLEHEGQMPRRRARRLQP